MLRLKEMIAAVTAGYEVMIRLGFVGGDRFLARGYHTSSLLGSFGAAASIGNLAGTAPEKIVDALGISGTFASGIQESTRTGSTSKILHGGWGAHAGMLAIDLAQAGITGPESVFEGKFGFFETHLTPIKGQLDFVTGGSGFGTQVVSARHRVQTLSVLPVAACLHRGRQGDPQGAGGRRRQRRRHHALSTASSPSRA